MSTERNRRVAMDFLVTAGRGDMEAFLATITDDVEFQTMGCSIVSAKRNRAELIELVGSGAHGVVSLALERALNGGTSTRCSRRCPWP